MDRLATHLAAVAKSQGCPGVVWYAIQKGKLPIEFADEDLNQWSEALKQQVTEKHDSPWVRARQEQLEADVQRSWCRRSTRRGRLFNKELRDYGRTRKFRLPVERAAYGCQSWTGRRLGRLGTTLGRPRRRRRLIYT